MDRLDDAGFVAYVVGGSVRDFLLGRETKDHDIATDASPDELVKLFPDAITVGKAFGVIKVPVKSLPGAPPVEIATFREDLEYHDHRHPKGVKFSGPMEDARRRDFTVNALFYDPKTSRILDPTGGMEDLRAGKVRAIGDAEERFREDALRLVRAVRFATALGFELDAATTAAVRAKAKLIAKVSAERVRDELSLMWSGPRPADALRMLSQLGLLKQLLPEVEGLKGVDQSPVHHPEGDVWSHTVKLLQALAFQLPKRSNTLGWAALLHDIGKPLAARRSGGKNFNGHEIEGSRIALAVSDRFKLSRADAVRVAALIENHLKFKDVFQMRESTLQRFLREPFFEELLALHKADASASDGNLAFHEFCEFKLRELRESESHETPRLLDGKDLIQLGLQPGPEFSGILRVIEDLALEKKLRSKEEALEYVVRHFVK